MTNGSHIIAADRSFFCAGQCRNSHSSGGGTIFDAEFAQNAFDVLVDRPGACAEDHADRFKSYVIGGQRVAAVRIVPGMSAELEQLDHVNRKT